MASSIVFLAVVFLLACWQLRSTVILPRRWQVHGPACGNCGYSYGGQPLCPECGHAIMHVGIVTPRLLILFGPGPWVALGCLLVMGSISWAAMLQLGVLIQTQWLPASASPGFAATLQHTGMRQEISFAYRPSPDAMPPIGGFAGRKASFGLTVVEQSVRSTAGSPPQPLMYGEVVMVLRPELERPFPEASPQPVSSFSPPFPHLRIDLVRRSVLVFDGKGVQIARYVTVDRRGFDDLIQASGIDRSDAATEQAIPEAATVYQAIADSPDSGGPFPAWSDQGGLLKSVSNQKPIRIMRSGGTIRKMPPIPAALVPPPPAYIYVWPVLVPLMHSGAVAFAFRWILRRRREIMQAGAASASAPAAS